MFGRLDAADAAERGPDPAPGAGAGAGDRRRDRRRCGGRGRARTELVPRRLPDRQRGDEDTAAALVSGSGRSSFWGAALDAFGDDPLRGIGAGGYATYWNMNGDLACPPRNAHSAQLETLAELGLPGGLVLLAALGLGAWRRGRSAADGGGRGCGRSPLRSPASSPPVWSRSPIDWTWELPAALAPMLISLALLCGSGLRPRGAAVGALVVDPRMAGYEHRDVPVSPSPGRSASASELVGAGLDLGGSGAGGIPIQLDRSADRLAAGDLSGAAEAARGAARIEPWSPEPALRLAEVEQTGGQSRGRTAPSRARRSRLAPDDFRPWLLLGQIDAALGNGARGRARTS